MFSALLPVVNVLNLLNARNVMMNIIYLVLNVNPVFILAKPVPQKLTVIPVDMEI